MRARRLAIALAACAALAWLAAPACAARLWTAPAPIGGGDERSVPALATDGHGTTMLAWTEYDGSDLVIYASTARDGGAWSTPEEVTRGGYPGGPQLAMDATGTAIVAWREWDGGAIVDAKARVRRPDGTWGPIEGLSGSDPFRWGEGPVVALDGKGHGVAVYTRQSPAELMARRYDGGWSTGFTLGVMGADTRAMAVALDEAGTATALYLQSDGSHVTARACTFTIGACATPTALSAAGADVTELVASGGADGSIAAAWVRGGRAQGSTFRNGAWAPTTTLATGDSFGIVTAIDASGRAVAAWSESEGADTHIRASTTSARGTWRRARRLTSPGTYAVYASTAIAGGVAAVAWVRSTGGIWPLETATHDATGWSAPQEISRPSTVNTGSGLAVDPGGAITAAWQDQDGGGIDRMYTSRSAYPLAVLHPRASAKRAPSGGTARATVAFAPVAGATRYAVVARAPGARLVRTACRVRATRVVCSLHLPARRWAITVTAHYVSALIARGTTALRVRSATAPVTG